MCQCGGHNFADKENCYKCGIDKREGLRSRSRSGSRKASRSRSYGRRSRSRSNRRRSRSGGRHSRSPSPYYGGRSHSRDRRGGGRHPDRSGYQKKTSLGRASGNWGGDWECSKCGVSNFARRIKCFRCNTDRPRDADRGSPRRSRSYSR